MTDAGFADTRAHMLGIPDHLGAPLMTERELSVDVGRETLTCLLAEPEQIAERPALLLNFAADRNASMRQGPFDITPRMFADAGHRAVSFDLPCHGDRIVPGHPFEIAGFAAEWSRGRDVFAQFVDDGRAVIDALLRQGLAEAGYIFLSGVSRGGYFALRLMAADTRIKAAAAFAPVTDWRALDEFASIKDRAGLAELALSSFAPALGGRPVWAAIGNRDRRVGTECFLRFAEAMVVHERTLACPASRLECHVVPEEGHTLSEGQRRQGGEYLLSFTGIPTGGEPACC